MESFEHLVKIKLEADRYVVMTNVKFPVARLTKNGVTQTHGYEVDVVAARHKSLILGSVKSFLGSTGVNREGFRGIAKKENLKQQSLYKLFNDFNLRSQVFERASERYGYPTKQIRLILYAGKFKNAKEEDLIRQHLETVIAGAGPITVVGLRDIIQGIYSASDTKTYIDDPVITTMKSLKLAEASGILSSLNNF